VFTARYELGLQIRLSFIADRKGLKNSENEGEHGMTETKTIRLKNTEKGRQGRITY